MEQIEVIKHKIEIRKNELDMFVKAITRHAFIENCTGGSYFNDMFNELMINGVETIHKSILPEKELEKVRYNWSPTFVQNMTDIEMANSDLKYQERLVNWAKYALENLEDEKKEQIIMDTIEQQDIWSEQFNRNSELYDKLKIKEGDDGPKSRKTKT